MLRFWLDQYWATLGLTEPLKALALKAGALARTLVSTVKVSAPLGPEPIEPLAALLEPVALFELLLEPAVVAIEVAMGVPVELAPLLAGAVGVLFPLEELLLLEEPPVAFEKVKACQGTSTW